ncbi:MAG: flagellar basal body-associated FliL family protein [Betaproteobacteria bacterium]|jgi:flagellar FliL protein|nr:flagellar basal body-associated FliL family protein [Rhodocyclaceae bacterium]MCA3133054.1 flagellar basal body-associated FliL family protein [Rhodocyclaceae bacterium]MCA3141867.1 flagellar basal body-associated FliL family protein [Rhodocyclaceae bacterium]MCA3144775.1 flagellar basal body-associated FliL family protein [Rhodocyclaceae bacterium]MCE2896645.1 flagellar basal body-associated FliL family protein [Betaproteobacteria bacterium]
MAEKAEAAEAAEQAPARSGKKKKLILLVAALALLAVLGGGGYWLFVMKPSHEAGEGSAEQEALQAAKGKPPVFVSLDPFTVNLVSEASDRYLQVGIDLKVSGPEVGDKIKVHLPEIRNGVLLLLTSKRVEDLASAEGKNLLREEIRDVVNRPIGFLREMPVAAEGEKPAPKPPQAGVLDVLLTSFVIQ